MSVTGKRPRSATAMFLFSLALVTLSIVILLLARESRSGLSLDANSGSALTDEKVREEILKLRHDRGIVASLPAYGALAGVFGTAAGVFFTARQQIGERRAERVQREVAIRNEEAQRQRQLDQDRQASEAAERQRETEALHRFDETMKTVMADLRSPDAVRRAGAVASVVTWLQTLLRPPLDGTFQDPVLLLIVATLRLEDVSEDVRRMLCRAFEKAIRLRLAKLEEVDRRTVLDLSRARLEGVELAGLDFHGADLGWTHLEGAHLRGANLERVRGFNVFLDGARLTGANLNEARLRQAQAPRAQFNAANLVSARLEDAVLPRAEFFKARLQSAHFTGADLRGARFEGANVNDTFFAGAVLDGRAIAGLGRARNWRLAHYDPKDLMALEQANTGRE